MNCRIVHLLVLPYLFMAFYVIQSPFPFSIYLDTRAALWRVVWPSSGLKVVIHGLHNPRSKPAIKSDKH